MLTLLAPGVGMGTTPIASEPADVVVLILDALTRARIERDTSTTSRRRLLGAGAVRSLSAAVDKIDNLT